jgi:hypothetical protein
MSNIQESQFTQVQSPVDQILPEGAELSVLPAWAVAAGRAALLESNGAVGIVFSGSSMYVIVRAAHGYKAMWAPVLRSGGELYDDEISHSTIAEALSAVIQDFAQADEDIDFLEQAKLGLPPVAVFAGMAVPLAA